MDSVAALPELLPGTVPLPPLVPSHHGCCCGDHGILTVSTPIGNCPADKHQSALCRAGVSAGSGAGGTSAYIYSQFMTETDPVVHTYVGGKAGLWLAYKGSSW